MLLAYMTGILPIARSYPADSTLKSGDFIVDASGESLRAVFSPDASYSSGSELNMFSEYSMATEERFSEYFGFTEREVDMLYERYRRERKEPVRVTREGLKVWYDGYQTKGGERLYNPRSVVMSLSNNNLGNYWTSSGPYDEIFYYIKNNVDAVRDDIARMAAGEAVPAKVKEYAATSQELRTKEEILSAMVVYGFLSYEDGMVSIPNRELKVDHSPQEAIDQIKERNYVLRFAGNAGQSGRTPRGILLVGIGYDRKTKKHCCRVEEITLPQ